MNVRVRSSKSGFALPTVIISSLVMFAVLVSVVSSVSSARASLDSQFYEQLARDARESGASRAADCLKNNNYTATWSAANPLRPNTTCSGGAVCTNTANCFVVKTDTYSSSYSIGAVATDGAGVQKFTIDVSVNLLKKSNGAVAKTITSAGITEIGSEVSTNKVVFGYQYGVGAFFATINRDGTMRAAGLNANGQLGNGTTTSTLVPTKFAAPTTSPIVEGYSSFLSMGTSMFAIDKTGKAFGAGLNNRGQIGGGSGSSTVATPIQVALAAGKIVRTVVVGGETNFFLTTDMNIYAAGACGLGMLGSNYVISGCSNASTPVRVTLPFWNWSDANTYITTNIVTDAASAFVRMSGGRVYGWGNSQSGELGLNSYGMTSNPVQIGTFGNAGQPKAVQVAYDGRTVYVLDDTGKLSSMGLASTGQNGSRTSSLHHGATKTCFNNPSSTTIQLAACNGSAAQRFQYRSDSTLYHASTNRCLDNASGDGVTLRLWTCNGTATQVFNYGLLNGGVHGTYYNPQSNKCIDNAGGNGVTLQLYTCNSTSSQYFDRTTTWFEPFNMTGITGQITAITTDQWHISALTTEGEVWSAGLNTGGMFGAGVSNGFTPDPVKFQLPSGVKATQIYATHSGGVSEYTHQNLYVVGSNGRVYGAGGNSYGQLGYGSKTPRSLTPMVMSVIDGTTIRAKEVQVGRGTAIVFTDTGKVYTVGNNSHGQIGDGTTADRTTPYYSQYINETAPTQY